MNPMLHHSYISYVNLDKRPERRARMETELRRVGLEAVRTRGMLPEEYKGDPRRIHGMLVRPQKGAIGCYFSQLSIMRKAQAMNLHAFVMEDDLQFCDDFLLRMDLISEFLDQRSWDILWLGATFHVGPPWWHKEDLGRDAEQTDDPRMMRTYGAFCTYAYIINSFSIPRILNALEYVLPTSIGIDYSFIQIQPGFQAFAFVPGSVIQYDHQSDIGHGMTEFSKFSKLGPYWFQKRMEDFDPAKYNWAEARRRK